MAYLPGQMSISWEKFYRVVPIGTGWFARLYRRLRQWPDYERILTRHMQIGDSRAAVVVSVDPLLVAAYTDELDCVAVLKFPDWLVDEYGLREGSKLLTVNTYFDSQEEVAEDLRPGPADSERWKNFYPVIADFISDDARRIQKLKGMIPESEWQRCLHLGRKYLREFPGYYRDGSPIYSAASPD